VNTVLSGNPTPRLTPIGEAPSLPNAGNGRDSANAILAGLLGALLVGGGLGVSVIGLRLRR
jgi:hypothetical protein